MLVALNQDDLTLISECVAKPFAEGRVLRARKAAKRMGWLWIRT